MDKKKAKQPDHVAVSSKIDKRVASRMVGVHLSGSLPDADSFAKYNSVVPGAGERILSIAE